MYVVGFAGPARVGKTAITNELMTMATSQGWRVEVMPFAGPLKNAADEAGFGKDVDPDGYRKYCQEVGAERRAEDENYWLNQWNADVVAIRDKHWEEDTNKPLLVIADDVRYENELNAIRNGGGTTIFLSPGDRELPEAAAAWRTHESEMLANTMIGNDDMRAEYFDYNMINDKESTTLASWAKNFFNMVVNFPGTAGQICDCEGCKALLENRNASVDQLLADLEDLMEEMDNDIELEDDDNE